MPITRLSIATRSSQLAITQAQSIRATLLTHYAYLNITLLPITTVGDKVLDKTLDKIGGKGLFVKELELALLEKKADFAVHSMKDVPMTFPEGLALPVIGARVNVHDALISNHFDSLFTMPAGSTVGTASMRRKWQLQAYYPALKVELLRGNIQTRLAKLDAGDFDAIILAAAGLERMNLAHRISEILTIEQFLPAAGQGALGIECRGDDLELIELLSVLIHRPTFHEVSAERLMCQRLGGNCSVAIAAYAKFIDNTIIHLKGFIASPDGRIALTAEAQADSWQEVGNSVADDLIKQGALQIVAQYSC